MTSNEEEAFVVSLSEDERGIEIWAACCKVCGECFAYLTFPDERIIQRLEDHEHLDEPDIIALLRMGGQPGNCDDNLLRAMGVPDELL